ncbi:hypothetical protein CMO89_01880 [Candidatus Woesearchaeota archaeon]|nr:hypothetical protein [Candidatus Woesearchaeota archaeon]
MKKKQAKRTRSKLRAKQKSRHISKKAAIVLITIAIVISFFLVRPRLTGFTSVTKEYTITDNVNIIANESSEYTWVSEEKGSLKGMKISGTVLRAGTAKVYLNYSNELYLIFDSEQLETALSDVTGMVAVNDTVDNQTTDDAINQSVNESDNETQALNETEGEQSTVNESIEEQTVNQTTNQTDTDEPAVNQSSENISINKSIQLSLDYYTDSSYDADNDGLEEIEGVVDLAVKGTELNFNASPDNLCTKWTINSVDKGTTNNVCYGSSSCCNFLDMDSSSAEWNDPYYSYFEKEDAGYNNIVSAQVVYAYYDLITLEAEIVYSNSSSLSVRFKAPYIEFNGICLETCLLPGLNETNYTLIFEIDNSTLNIGSITYTVEKMVPNDHSPKLVKNISEINIVKNKNQTINLSEYFYDEDGDIMSYSYYETENISVTIDKDIAVIAPDKDFTGIRSSFFIANDSKFVRVSNVFRINVSEEDKDVNVSVAKPSVVIGKPVKWVKKIKLLKDIGNVSINITKDAFNISVKDAETNTELDKSKINVKENNKLKELEEYEAEKENKREEKEEKREASKITGAFAAITGFSALDDINEDTEANVTELIIEEPAEELEVEYYTEGPTAEEIIISDYKKRITVSSDIHYEDILSYTYLPVEVPANNIKLYWINNGSRTRVATDKFDKNNNSFIDYIEWVVPSLSNQTYELELIILNTQSYPTRGGNWTVMFNANGVGNLTISASNGTSYTKFFKDNSSTINDLELLNLRCGDNVFFNKDSLFMRNNTYLILENSTKIGINETLNSSLELASLFVGNYFCNTTGYHTVRVLTDGKHTQLFNFSGYYAYAYNLVNNPPTTEIVFFSDGNSTRTQTFLS